MDPNNLYIGGGIFAALLTILKGKDIWVFFGKVLEFFKHLFDGKSRHKDELILLLKEQISKLEERNKDLEKKKAKLEKLLTKR
jgi:hypothetical protein